jgi:hypothetical protein
MSGATHLDVEALNRRLKSNGAMRMRHAMRPDEQYGDFLGPLIILRNCQSGMGDMHKQTYD